MQLDFLSFDVICLALGLLFREIMNELVVSYFNQEVLLVHQVMWT